MKWPSMFAWLLVGVSCCAIRPVVAEVAHISINLRMFDVGKLPLLKINIVSNVTDTDRFQFIMHQSSGEERLMVSRINDFMLLVQGVDEVTDSQAVLQVKEYRDNYWMDVATLPLFADSVPVGAPPGNKKLALYKLQPATVSLHRSTSATSTSAALSSSIVTTPTAPEVTSVGSPAMTIEGCTLEYDGEQTLWRLASRYAKEWQTNVYAAAIGIFESNPQAFARGNPSGLRRDATLHCPSSEVLAQYTDKRAAEKKFDSLL